MVVLKQVFFYSVRFYTSTRQNLKIGKNTKVYFLNKFNFFFKCFLGFNSRIYWETRYVPWPAND